MEEALEKEVDNILASSIAESRRTRIRALGEKVFGRGAELTQEERTDLAEILSVQKKEAALYGFTEADVARTNLKMAMPRKEDLCRCYVCEARRRRDA